jgi:prepilin-type N-terminal cleavage/methylation domain-containing protein
MKRNGFTLIELLVVIFIVVLVSAVTLPAVLPALSHREVSEGARIFQAALVGTRDAAIRAGEPRGLRLLPDPTLTIPSQADTLGTPGVAGSSSLAYNRFVQLEMAPQYTEGFVTIGPQLPPGASLPNFPPAYPQGYVGFGATAGNTGVYPYPDSSVPAPILMIEQSLFIGGYTLNGGTPTFNPPTNWMASIRPRASTRSRMRRSPFRPRWCASTRGRASRPQPRS